MVGLVKQRWVVIGAALTMLAPAAPACGHAGVDCPGPTSEAGISLSSPPNSRLADPPWGVEGPCTIEVLDPENLRLQFNRSMEIATCVFFLRLKDGSRGQSARFDLKPGTCENGDHTWGVLPGAASMQVPEESTDAGADR